MNQLKKQHTKRDILNLFYTALFVIMIIRVISICLSGLRSSDFYFLINTGKYIVNTKSIPTTNIWTIHEDFKIVIQQWLCCVENYIAYSIGQNLGLSVLAIIHTVILNMLLFKFIGLYTHSKRIMVLALCLSNYFASEFMNARPSLVTMSILTYELIQLEQWNRSPKDKKSNIKLLINLAFISLFHINYHSSLWLMDILFVLPYMTPALWELDIHNLKKSLFAQENKRDLKILAISIPLMTVTALMNPNGINAITYTLKASGMFKIYQIDELLPWSINVAQAMVIIAIITIFIIYLIKNGRDKSIIYLTVGTIILSMSYKRNFWMIMFSAIMLLTTFLDKKEHKQCLISIKKYNTVKIVLTTVILAWAIALTHQSLYTALNIRSWDDDITVIRAIEYLDNLSQEEKDSLVIYNEFNSGACLELNGYKTYIDARPEIYQKSINGKADIYQEWAGLQKGLLDIPNFINKYNFNTFIVDTGKVLHCYLNYNDNYEKVVQGNGYAVYTAINQ